MKLTWKKVFFLSLVVAAVQLLFQEFGVLGFSALFVTEFNMDTADATTIQINDPGPVPIYIAYPLGFLINFTVAIVCTSAIKLVIDGVARLVGSPRVAGK